MTSTIGEKAWLQFVARHGSLYLRSMREGEEAALHESNEKKKGELGPLVLGPNGPGIYFEPKFLSN